MSIVTKIFGTYSDHQLKKIEKIASRIEALATTYKQMDDEELRGQTELFKSRLATGCWASDPSMCSCWAASSCTRGASPR